MVSLSEPLPEHYDELRRVTLALAAEVKAKRLEIEALTLELARLKRRRFGASTELGDRVTFDTAAGRGIVGTLMRYNKIKRHGHHRPPGTLERLAGLTAPGRATRHYPHRSRAGRPLPPQTVTPDTVYCPGRRTPVNVRWPDGYARRPKAPAS